MLWPPIQTLLLHTGSHPAFSGGFRATRALATHAVRSDGSTVPLADLRGKPLAAVAGIANPAQFFDMLRNEGRIPTIAVGNVTDPDQVNGIIASGRADLVAIGRPHLSDPHWTLHAAAALGYTAIVWPQQYYLGRVQHEREVARAAAARSS